MKQLFALTGRNCKLFFKDKGMFFTSLITPAILLVLYVTFLGNVYRNSFVDSFGATIELPKKLIEGLVGGQLVSSLLAVSCVTVAFCSNLLMVQDKVSGAIRDLTIAPVGKATLALSYFLASAFSTLLICLVTCGLGFAYLAKVGWYLSVTDVFLLLSDILLLVLFGTALSSILLCHMSTHGQASAVGTVISSGYGFICGAYMPLYNFSETLRNVLGFLPGTYGTSLVRNHAMRGAFAELGKQGIPDEALNNLKKSIDCELSFFGHAVSQSGMQIILVSSVAVLIVVYVLVQSFRIRKKA